VTVIITWTWLPGTFSQLLGLDQVLVVAAPGLHHQHPEPK